MRNRAELLSFLETNLHQLGRAAVPFVNTAYDNPERLAELDALCDAFLSNHVANRASRLQGRAFLTAMERIFLERGCPPPQHCHNEDGVRSSGVPLSGGVAAAGDGRAPFAHFAPVFGACLRDLDIPRDTSLRLFLFNHLRSGFAAAVRLNIVGPMEAQRLQHRLAPMAVAVAARAAALTLDDLAQTAPLLDLWQGAQDRLYSRLFQS